MGIDVIAITNSEKARLLNFQQSQSLLYNNREKFHCRRNVPTTALFLIEKLAKTVSTMLNECP